MIILKVAKNQGLALSLKDTFLEIDPPPAFKGLRLFYFRVTKYRPEASNPSISFQR